MTIVVGIATVIGAVASVLALGITIHRRHIHVSRLRPTLNYRVGYLKDRNLVPRRDPFLHRDVKPENIFIVEAKADPGQAVKVAIAPRTDAFLLQLMRGLRIGKPRSHAPRPDVPKWALGLLAAEDAHRYGWEWGAHLLQLVEEGELRQARRDRRRLAFSAIALAVALRVRNVLRKAR